MARNKPRTILYRRKREKRTNYKKRLHLLLSPDKARLVARFSNQRIVAQIVSFTTAGDKVLLGVDSFFLKKHKWAYSCKNMPAAYLTGYFLAKKALKQGVKDALFDTGFKTPLKKGKLYAFLKGAVEGGLNIPHDSEKNIFPDEDRIVGKHVENYLAKVDTTKTKNQFAQYLKNGAKSEGIAQQFEQVKQAIGSA